MSDDLVKRLTKPMVPYDSEVDAQDFWEDLCGEAKDHIEALTAQLAEDADVRTQIDHRIEELVAQVDALTADNAQLREAAEGVDGFLRGYKAYERSGYGPKLRAALNTGKEVMPPVPVTNTPNASDIGPGNQAVAGASEICTPSIITYDDEGNPSYTFNEDHSWRDVARWIAKNPADLEEMIYILVEMKLENNRLLKRVGYTVEFIGCFDE